MRVEMIVLIQILKKVNIRVCNGLKWFRVGFGGSCATLKVQIPYRREISALDE
jgi:hypothetical protein